MLMVAQAKELYNNSNDLFLVSLLSFLLTLLPFLPTLLPFLLRLLPFLLRLLPFLLRRQRVLNKAVKDVELLTREIAVMPVVGGQQTTMQGEPVLTEVVSDQLEQFVVDIVHISGLLLDSLLFLEQQLRLLGLDLVLFP